MVLLLFRVLRVQDNVFNNTPKLLPLAVGDHFNGHKLHSTCIGTHEMDSTCIYIILAITLVQCPGPDGVVPVAKIITITERGQRKNEQMVL